MLLAATKDEALGYHARAYMVPYYFAAKNHLVPGSKPLPAILFVGNNC